MGRESYRVGERMRAEIIGEKTRFQRENFCRFGKRETENIRKRQIYPISGFLNLFLCNQWLESAGVTKKNRMRNESEAVISRHILVFYPHQHFNVSKTIMRTSRNYGKIFVGMHRQQARKKEKL